MIEKLYHPMGAENIGYWLTDSENTGNGLCRPQPDGPRL